jgi:hypothetical protein
VLAGFAAPGDPDGTRMRVDAIIVACEQGEDLAREIARLWPVEDYGTALDLAVVEGLAVPEAQRHQWKPSAPSSLTGVPGQMTGLTRLTAASGGTEGFPK